MMVETTLSPLIVAVVNIPSRICCALSTQVLFDLLIVLVRALSGKFLNSVVAKRIKPAGEPIPESPYGADPIRWQKVSCQRCDRQERRQRGEKVASCTIASFAEALHFWSKRTGVRCTLSCARAACPQRQLTFQSLPKRTHKAST